MIDVSMAKLTGKIPHTVQLQCGNEREGRIYINVPMAALCP